jgi:uncharacterized protein (TIGR02466 family)
MSFADFNVKHLFPTPLVIASFPPVMSERLNDELEKIILAKEEESKGVVVSNRGGWQSDDKILEWGGAPIKTVATALTELIDQITLHMEGTEVRRVRVDWRIHGWANVNRKGNANVPHVHPGAYWSAVYYVRTDSDESKGGELELIDPRGVVPILYCPKLRFGIQGYITAGMSELHAPKPGQCVVFPSWLAHAVRIYSGDTTRISIAFNYSV